ncbi:hypothetical protein Bca4012_042099 [Brassica carinata]|uniref:Uncharacterized protein n=1 Tax=Brassica carinata TaxID=52824 RepID=A0A8X7UIX1_BRACI|nr:hypothetical protein Bca52824_060151 [Brassica carinata]
MEVSMAVVGGICYRFGGFFCLAGESPEVSSHLLTYLSARVGVGALSHVWHTVFTVQINRS